MGGISGLDWIWQGGRQKHLGGILTGNWSSYERPGGNSRLKVKQYTDRKIGARALLFKPGDSVRVELRRRQRKGKLRYSEPRKIIHETGRSSFVLGDNKTWNASKFSRVLHPSKSPKDHSLPVENYWDPEGLRWQEDVILPSGSDIRDSTA